MFNVYSEIKTTSAGEKEVFLQEPQKRTAKFSLLPWNSELLAAIGARTNKKTSFTEVPISPGEKIQLSEAGKRKYFPQYKKPDNWNCSSIKLQGYKNTLFWKNSNLFQEVMN